MQTCHHHHHPCSYAYCCCCYCCYCAVPSWTGQTIRREWWGRLGTWGISCSRARRWAGRWKVGWKVCVCHYYHHYYQSSNLVDSARRPHYLLRWRQNCWARYASRIVGKTRFVCGTFWQAISWSLSSTFSYKQLEFPDVGSNSPYKTFICHKLC